MQPSTTHTPRRLSLLVAVLVLGVAAPAGAIVPAASRAGSAAPTVTVDKPDPSSGWSIRMREEGTYQVSWRSPRPLPVTADRPGIEWNGTPLGSTSIGPDGRTVTATLRSAQRPRAEDLDVVLSGRSLTNPDRRTSTVPSTPGPTPGPTPDAATEAAPASPLLPVDPADSGPQRTAKWEYQLPSVTVPGMEQPVEMVGHVVNPAGPAVGPPRPLVVFLHGRHEYCYVPGDDYAEPEWPCRAPAKEVPSQLGYHYIQARLASQGFTTVSIRVNGINAQDYLLSDGGAAARALVVRRHLDHWASIAAAQNVDMSKVVLVGHSRGGEGVDRASIQIPLDAPYRIVGQVLLAPTNFGSQTAPYIPTVTLLPSCDGDVMDLQGQRFTDMARDLLPDDTSLKSSVMIRGANHNWFNTEWTEGISAAPSADDWWGDPTAVCGRRHPGRLKASQQRDVGLAYVAAAVRLFARNETQFLPLFDGSGARVRSTGSAVVLSHAVAGGRRELRPGVELTAGASTGRLRLCAGTVEEVPGSCGVGVEAVEAAPHWYAPGEFLPSPRSGIDFSWTRSGRSANLDLASPVDVRGRRLELRMVVDQRYVNVKLRVRLRDATGAVAEQAVRAGGELTRMAGATTIGKRWGQTLLVPVPSGAIDLSRVTRIELISATTAGRVVVLDAATAPNTLVAVPARRGPLLSVGRVEVPEGNGNRAITVKVPVTLAAPSATETKFRYRTNNLMSGDSKVATAVIPAGSTTGWLPVTYAPNTYFNPNTVVEVGVIAEAGAMTDAYDGSLTIIDDDPVPTVTVVAENPVVAEGGTARIRMTLSEPLAFWSFVNMSFLPVNKPFATVGDIAPRFFSYPMAPTDPLWWYYDAPSIDLAHGARSVVFEIPTRRDGIVERPELMRVGVSVWMGDHSVDRAVDVTIVDA